MDTLNDKIVSFYKQPNQLTNILRILRVIIDFIVSSRSHIEMKIFDYATEVLKMKIHNENNDICKDIYDMETNSLRSLWISLSMHRSILLTKYGQDPFDRLNEKYKKRISLRDEKIISDDLDDNSKDSLATDNTDKHLTRIIMNGKDFLNVKHIKLLINILYNLIWFKLSTPIKINRNNSRFLEDDNTSDDNEDGYGLEMKLKDILLEIGTNESELVNDNDIQINEIVNEFNFDRISLENVYHVWILFVKTYLPA